MRLIDADALAYQLTKMWEYALQDNDLFGQGEMSALVGAIRVVNEAPTVHGLNSVKEQPDSKCVTLSETLVIRVRFFMREEDLDKIKRRLEEQIKNGDKVLILPDYMEPVIIPKDTEVHIETEPIGVFPGRINPSLSVNPPRIVPKNDKRGHSK